MGKYDDIINMKSRANVRAVKYVNRSARKTVLILPLHLLL